MTSIYTKLTPTKRQFFGYSRLWLAPDHILLLNSTYFAEDYKRFAFADIQSIVVTELPSRLVLQIIMILAALAWTSLFFVVNVTFLKWTFVITGAFALFGSIRDIARGQRCRCYLHTRVSKELLTPVARMKTARSFLATIRPKIEAVQGSFEPMSDQPAATETPASQPTPPEIVASPGYVPEVLFALFLIDAAVIAASIRFPDKPELPGILIYSLFCEVLLILVALVRRRGRDFRVIIYIVIVLSIVGFAFDAVTMSRELFRWYLALLEKTKNGDKSGVFMTLFPAGGWRPTLAWAWRTAAGVIGLAAAFYERRKQR